jgi:hypothetical protein
MKFDDDLNACAAIVERGDPERFRAIMLTPVRARAVLFPIYAFNVEIARAPWVTKEPMIAHMRLQWWRDALEEIASGGIVRRHEVVTPLAHLLNPEQARLLIETVEARRWDVDKEAFENEDAFEKYILATSGHLLYVCVQLLGLANKTVVYNFAYATGLSRYLVAVSAIEKTGRIPLVDGRSSAISALAKDAMKRLKTARQQRSLVDKKAKHAFFGGHKCQWVLERIIENPMYIMEDNAFESYNPRTVGSLYRVFSGRW